MARPIKKGLDYFPLDFTLFSDRKFRKARQKHGFLAVGIYLSLLKIIYRDEGYYIDYQEKRRDDIIWEIQEDMAGRYQPTTEVVSDVIDLLVASELFSVDHYKEKIITSKRIQITYYTAKKKSVCTTIKPNVWMLTKEEMFKLGANNPILKCIFPEETIVNSEITGVNSELTTQSKEQESKTKQSKEEESSKIKPKDIVNLYNEKCNNLVKCTMLTEGRTIAIKNAKLSFEEWQKLFQKANSSYFLQGKNNNGFKATFDWLVKPDNIVKVLEGNYDKFINNGNSQIIQDKHEYTQNELDLLFNKNDESNFDFREVKNGSSRKSTKS